MPWTYSFDPRCEAINIISTGVLTRTEIFTQYAAMQADPRFDPRSRVLADYTQTTRIEMSALEVDELARFARFTPDTKRALLIAPGVVAGITAFFAAAYRSRSVKTFTERSTALRWLNEGVAPEKALT
jgi:hypothetical protein